MPFRITVVCLILAALVPLAGLANEDAIAITGSILGPDGEPLAGARAELFATPTRYQSGRQVLVPGLEPTPAASTRSDQAGEIRLKAPGPGMWRVRVSAEGHLAVEHRLEPLLMDMDLGAVALPASEPVVVQAWHHDSSPAEAARVEIVEDPECRLPVRTPGFRWGLAQRGGWTDSEGTLGLGRAVGETPTVRLILPGWPMDEAVADQDQVPLLRPEGYLEQELRVVSAQGRPVANALLWIDDDPWPFTVSNDLGYDGVPSTDRAFSILAESPDGSRWIGRVPEHGLDRALLLTLIRLPRLVGKVLGPDGPLAGALVWADADPGVAVRTDENGTFELQSPGPGRMALMVAARGFFIERVVIADVQALSSKALGSAAGSGADPRAELDPVRLTPASTIRGRTVDPDGRPWAGVLLRLEAASEKARRRWRETVVSSSPEGRLVIPFLVPGQRYELQATGVGLSTISRVIEAPLDTSRPSEIELVLVDGRSVVGRILDSEEMPLAGASVSLAPDGGSGEVDSTMIPESVESDAEGLFEIDGVAPSLYRLQVLAGSHAPLIIPRLVVPEGESPFDLGTLILSRGAVLEGTVVSRDGETLEGARVRVWIDRGSSPDQEIQESREGRETGEAWSTETDAAGGFRLDELIEGSRLALEASLEGYASSRLDEIRVPTAEPVRLVLLPGARISGQVVTADGVPLEQAVVEVEVEESVQASDEAVQPPSHEPWVVTVDESGEFVVEDAVPGRLSLLATARGYPPATLDGIDVAPGEAVDGLRIVLQPGSALVGTITDTTGRPVVRAQVFAKVDPLPGPGTSGLGSGRALHGNAVSDESGGYRLSDLPAGNVLVEVAHPAYETANREILLSGEQRLDIVLESGPEISGRVMAEGSGVAGATVELVRASGMPLTGARTEVDGSFVLAGARAGRYRLVASHEGFGPATSNELMVSSSPITGVILELSQALAVSGRLLGLSREDLAEVEVLAGSSSLGIHQGVAAADGTYRIDDLAPGEWRVGGWVQRSGAKAEERVVLSPGAGEVELDLDFGTGRRLEGRVLIDGKALTRATVSVEGLDVTSSGQALTGAEGEFIIEGLVPGSYRLQVDQTELGLRHSEQVDVPAGREIVVAILSASISGRVVDARDERPIAGVELSLLAADAQGDPPSQLSDSTGRFSFSRVAAGWHRLVARRSGYSEQTMSLDVEPGRSRDDLRLALEPTEGLRVELWKASGRPVTEARLAVLQGAGAPVVAGTFSASYDGVLNLATVPPGRFRLLVSVEGHAPASADIQVPGDTVSLVLRPEARLWFRIPAIEGSDLRCRVLLLDPQGRPLEHLDWQGQVRQEWPRDGLYSTAIDRLPGGSFTLRVECPDGRSWQQEITLAEGTRHEIELS